MKKITVNDIAGMKAEKRKLPVLTAYNFHMARILDAVGIPIILVGDSVGMVEAGMDSTLPVTMDEMIYHAKAVRRGAPNAFMVVDMPFGSYQASIADAKRNALRFVKEAGAEAVKVEGGKRAVDAVKAILDMDVPVMGHVGLTPQSVHRMGGYRVQGRGRAEAKEILKDAKLLEEAGVFSIILEGMPAGLGKEITKAVSVPTIGIGAGPNCDGQVLVINDLLGLTPVLATDLADKQRTPRFVKRYVDLNDVITRAVLEYKKDVEKGVFPAKEHCY